MNSHGREAYCHGPSLRVHFYSKSNTV